MAVFNKGEVAVDLKTGAQFDVAETGELDESKYGRMEPGSKASPQEVLSAKPQAPAQEQGLIPPEVGKPAAQQSREEATRTSGELFRNVAVPAAQTGLALATGGMSLPAQALIGAGTEYALQKAGLNPSSPTQIGLQAVVPFAGKAIEGVKAGGRFIANLTGKGAKAGEQAAASRMGVPLDAYERAVTPPPSKAAYAAAEAGGQTPVQPARDAIQAALDKEQLLGSQANTKTVEYLQGILDDLDRAITSTGGKEDAGLLVSKAQRLGGKAEEAFAKKEKTGAIPLKEAAEGFNKSIPNMEKADTLFSREDVVNEVFKAMKSGKKVNALNQLAADKGSAFEKVMSKKEFEDIKLIAARIKEVGADAGLLSRGMDTAVKSFLADPNGLTVFRHAFGPTMERLKPERLAGLMTFIRAYNAQNQRKQP